MLLPDDPRAIATYRRVSKKEQSDNAPAYTRQEWDLSEACKSLFPDRERLIFEDIQSGRKNDRAGFLKLIDAIERDRVGVLIVTQINRITRDLETNARLGKLLERKKILIYEVFKGSFLRWENPQDWEYFGQSGIAGEKESRTLSERLKQTQRWYDSQGKFCYGRVGFPYRRSKDGYIEPDPDNWDKGVRAIEIVLEQEGSQTRSLIGIREELGLDRTRTWMSWWIRSPLLRGHTPKNTRDERGYRRKGGKSDLILNSHQSLFSDPRLVAIDAQRRLDRIIERAKRHKGNTLKYVPHPLSGLVYCARCGSTCHIRRVGLTPAGHRYTYAMCSNREMKAIGCGGGNQMGRRRSVNTPYGDIDRAVTIALAQRAAELIDLALAREPTEIPEDPQIAKLRGEIDRLIAMQDPDLADSIAKKTQRLNQLLLAPTLDRPSSSRRDEFVAAFASGEVLALASPQEKRIIYLEWVRRVDVDRCEIRVELAI